MNISLDKPSEIILHLDGVNKKTATGELLTCQNVSDFNDFDHPDVVKPTVFKGAKISKGDVKVKVPAKSIVVLTLK